MICCYNIFKPIKILHLVNKNNYKNRELRYGVCPICNIPIVVIKSNDIKTNIISFKKLTKNKAIKFLNKSLKEIDLNYSLNYNWLCNSLKYGLNRQVGNRLIQYTCDFFGNKRIVKIIET